MARQVLTPGQTFYVSTTGDDVNDGSQAYPWRTVQRACRFMIAEADLNGGANPVIQLADGTYNEDVIAFSHPVGGHLFTVRGNQTTPENVYINSFTCVDYGCVQLVGIRTKFLNAIQFGILDYAYMAFDATTGVHVKAQSGGSINVTGPSKILGGALAHQQTWGNASRISLAGQPVTIPAVLNFPVAFCLCTGGGITADGMTVTYSGAGVSGTTGQKYICNRNGVLDLSGTVFPGNVGGSYSHGGVVVAN